MVTVIKRNFVITLHSSICADVGRAYIEMWNEKDSENNTIEKLIEELIGEQDVIEFTVWKCDLTRDRDVAMNAQWTKMRMDRNRTTI